MFIAFLKRRRKYWGNKLEIEKTLLAPAGAAGPHQDRISGTVAVSAQPLRAEWSGEEWNAPTVATNCLASLLFFSRLCSAAPRLCWLFSFFSFFEFQMWALYKAPNLLFIGLIVKHGGGLGSTYTHSLTGGRWLHRYEEEWPLSIRWNECSVKCTSFCLANYWFPARVKKNKIKRTLHLWQNVFKIYNFFKCRKSQVDFISQPLAKLAKAPRPHTPLRSA